MQSLRTLRAVSFAEGLSLLALLFIAMPLKYMADLPMAVRIVGMLHGLLFIALAYTLIQARAEHDWPWSRVLKFLVAAVVPFGFVWIDRQLRVG